MTLDITARPDLKFRREHAQWENARGADVVPIAARFAIPITEDAIASLMEFLEFESHITVRGDAIGHDLHRLLGQADGWSSYAMACVLGNPETWNEGSALAKWKAFDRPRCKSDRLVIDVMDDAIADGWRAPPEIIIAIEGLREIAKTTRAVEQDAADNASTERDASQWAKSDARHDRVMAKFEYWRTKAIAADWVRTLGTDLIMREGTKRPKAALAFIRWARFNEEQDKKIMAWVTEMQDFDNAVHARAVGYMDAVQRHFIPTTDYVRDAKGTIEPNNIDNVAFLLRTIGAEVRFDAWRERIEIKCNTRTEPKLHWPAWTYLDDHIVSALRMRASQTKTRFTPAKDFLWDALLSLARANASDPALDMLADLQTKWDGLPRLSTWLSATCGVPTDPYHQAVSRSIIGGMVRRMRHPGCKHDTIPVFIGKQGTGKSTLLSLLSPNSDWYSESIRLGDEAKELVLALAGKAVCEIQEMGQRTRDVNAIKAMISRTTDAGRTAYARAVSERPRRNIFVASTNDESPLVDDSGNRRWLPVRCTREIDTAWFIQWRDQIIGEAASLEAGGDTFTIPREVWASASAEQEAARERADFEVLLDDRFGGQGLPAYVTAADLITFLRETTGRNVPAGRYRPVMKGLGFSNVTVRVEGTPTKAWLRGQAELATRYVLRKDRDHRTTLALQSAVLPPPPAPVRSAGPVLPPLPSRP